MKKLFQLLVMKFFSVILVNSGILDEKSKLYLHGTNHSNNGHKSFEILILAHLSLNFHVLNKILGNL